MSDDHITPPEVLQAGRYNVHKGVNIIYLPKWTRHSSLFLLPKHPNYHSTYSADVKAKVEEIADELNEAAETADEKGHPKVNKENAPRLGNRLHAFSRIMRRQLREFGKQHPGSHINALFRSMPSL